MSSWGRRAKIAILTATVSIYPIGYVIFNGPLLNRTFKRRYNVDEDVPEHLKALVIQEYNAWREKENRKPEDAIIKFYAQNQLGRCPLKCMQSSFF
jgi:hypothetical protein